MNKTLITIVAIMGMITSSHALPREHVDNVIGTFNVSYIKYDLDGDMQPVTRDMLKEAMELAKAAARGKTYGQSLEWVEESFDCDDHSLLLVGILRAMSDGRPVAAGLMHIPGHVFPIVFMEDGQIYRFEPATMRGSTPRPQAIGIDKPGHVFYRKGWDGDGHYVKPHAVIF